MMSDPSHTSHSAARADDAQSWVSSSAASVLSAESSAAAPAPGGRRRSFVPVVLATVATLVLGGASVARAVEVPPLDAHTDLEFSLDGSTWSDAPDEVLGAWGCDLSGAPIIPDPAGAIDGTPGVDPCSMSPGESVDRTYFVRNATNTGRAGRYEVGVGDFVVSEEAEFAVSSTITGDGDGDADARTVTLFGADTGQAAESPDRGAVIAAVELAPGESARVVDEVAVPVDPRNYAPNQSVSPRMWVSFSDVGVVDRDGDGLPDIEEDQLGTDPDDPLNLLPDGTVGRKYGPAAFLPTPPEGTTLAVDEGTLPDGLRLSDGALVGTPTSAGTFDVEFEVTTPAGATYRSIRRVVMHPAAGGGSAELPDVLWPVIVVGVIGVIVGPGVGSLAGFLDDAAGSLGSSDSVSSTGSGGSTGTGHGIADPGSGPASSASGGDPDRGDPTGPPTAADTDDTTNGTAHDSADSTAADSPGDGDTGLVPVNTVTPREGAPSSEWARANSDVRGSLASTGVGAMDLLLWALTASAAGATLLLLAGRRRRDEQPSDVDS